MPHVGFRLESSQHPDNHYGMLTLDFDGQRVSFYIKNDKAFDLASLIQNVGRVTWKTAINECIKKLKESTE